MLPSGNDASLALAIWGGKKLLTKDVKDKIANNNGINSVNKKKLSDPLNNKL